MKHLYFLGLASCLIALSCSKPTADTSQAPYIKLNNPMWLAYDSTEIFLSDFIMKLESVESVTIHGQSIAWDSSLASFWFKPSYDVPALMPMLIQTTEGPVGVVLKKSNKLRVEYTFNPREKTYQTVALKGEFNGWTESQTPLTWQDGLWKTDLILNQGKYQYQLVLDGMGQLDPDCDLVVDNQHGGFNSLLVVGEDEPSMRPLLITLRHNKHEIIIEARNTPSDFLVLWNNQFITNKCTFEDGLLSISIPREARDMARSWIRVFAYNQSGLANDLIIPLHQGRVVEDPATLTRFDLHANIIYNVFVDRFYNGDTSNDKRLPYDVVLPKANYMGGDLSGILHVIRDGYFEKLGVNALWISPIVQNTDSAYGFWPDPPTKFSAYHGYWPTSFTAIDSHFGTPDMFRQLVTSMHEVGMNLLLDVVANHVHETHPYFIQNPDHVTDLVLPDGSLNLERWDEHRLTTWFDTFLPSLDLENEGVSTMLSDSLLWWVTTYGIDGFRHDAAKHIPLSFWRMLTRKINNQVIYPDQRPVYQLGETYGSNELINSYIGKGLLDAQFDFNVYDAALGVFAGGQPLGGLVDRLHESLYYYGSHNLMCNITGNQDRGRFISYAGGDLRFDENAKKAGWTREINVGDPIGYERLKLLLAFNMTIPGIPGIYYGDEYGMPGGNDPDCRRMMRFGDQLNDKETETLEAARLLAHIRKQNMALIYGDFLFLEERGQTMSYARKYFGNTVYVILNNSSETFRYDLPKPLNGKKTQVNTHFGHELVQDAGGRYCEVKPHAFEIITINE